MIPWYQRKGMRTLIHQKQHLWLVSTLILTCHFFSWWLNTGKGHWNLEMIKWIHWIIDFALTNLCWYVHIWGFSKTPLWSTCPQVKAISYLTVCTWIGIYILESGIQGESYGRKPLMINMHDLRITVLLICHHTWEAPAGSNVMFS